MLDKIPFNLVKMILEINLYIIFHKYIGLVYKGNVILFFGYHGDEGQI
jgi:hypothetical protein